MVNYLGTVDNPNLFRDFITDEDRNILSVPMQSTSSDEPVVVVADVESPDERALRMNVSRDAITNYLGNRTEAMPSYSEPVVEDLLSAGQIPQSHFDAQAQQPIPMGQEPLPDTNDPWYSRIAGTVKNILGLSGAGLSSLAEPAGSQRTVMQDWADNFAASPFLSMPRNEVFQRMQAQANANLDRQGKYGREGSQAAPVQIYRYFLGELDRTRPDLTVAEKQKIAYEKMVESLHAGRSNITIGGTAKMSEQIAMQTYKDLYDAASDYQELAPRLESTIAALESDKFGTGGGDLGAWARDFAANWGILSDEEAANIASFNELNGRLRQSYMKSFKGAISNKEQDLISKALPGLGRSKAANIAMLKLILLQKQLQAESYETYAELTRQYRDPEDVNAAFAEYLKARYDKTVERVNAITGGRSGSDKSWGYKADEGEVMELE